MSRIGKQPVMLPGAVDVQVVENRVSVKGPKGQLVRDIHPDMVIRKESDRLLVERPSDSKLHSSLHGLTRTLINNMVIGVTNGFEKTLELTGVGYRASKQGNKLVLLMGYSHPVEIVPEEGLEIDVPAPARVIVKGMDKERVGNLAARIRAVREPEPYKAKGIKYEGEKIRRKAGKAGGKGKK
ncbi:MAG TPA: 50S ribosomal protein L6 [Desulfotomaculum sp.]|nr:MAG: 50S ribosomal protein L6 [Desulfotomaculum sp. 46_80]KUK85336.1 MAG: 50S ribosomal protein L6 [Desulfofundulus kuznetsovii]HAG10593.1 50S ribosomal protein L6 [Desulfotomaculum sp.]HBY03484.1 50S ribosomal protein L6 [Desulfotomaculum sp.]